MKKKQILIFKVLYMSRLVLDIMYRPEICLQFLGLILHSRFINDSMGNDELELCWARQSY